MGGNRWEGWGEGGVRTLQDLEILYVGILCVDVELDSGHRDIEEDAVIDLAQGGTAEMKLSATSLGCVP